MTSPVPVNATVDGSNRTFGQMLDHVTFGHVSVGSSSTPEQTFDINLGIGVHSATPSVVLFQPRQSVNQDNNWTDEFAVQVITATQVTTTQGLINHILVRVRRIDSNSGWGQDLRLDFLIIEV